MLPQGTPQVILHSQAAPEEDAPAHIQQRPHAGVVLPGPGLGHRQLAQVAVRREEGGLEVPPPALVERVLQEVQQALRGNAVKVVVQDACKATSRKPYCYCWCTSGSLQCYHWSIYW